jgi:hypothetical protein
LLGGSLVVMVKTALTSEGRMLEAFPGPTAKRNNPIDEKPSGRDYNDSEP